jgi:hypothetical protein
MKHIAPNAAGPLRPFIARIGLLLTASFLLAGLFIVGLIGLGFHPLR